MFGWQLFKRELKEMKFGDRVIDGSPFIAIVDIESLEVYSRYNFIELFVQNAYKHGLIRSKKYYAHINYWYDGSVGHTAEKFWDNLYKKEVSHSVVFMSRVMAGYTDSASLAKSISDNLLKTSNIILLIPEDEGMAKEEMAFYKEHFLDVPVVKLNSSDLAKWA